MSKDGRRSSDDDRPFPPEKVERARIKVIQLRGVWRAQFRADERPLDHLKHPLGRVGVERREHQTPLDLAVQPK